MPRLERTRFPRRQFFLWERSDGGICDHDDALSSSKLFVVGFRKSKADIAACCRPGEYEYGLKAFILANIGFAAIDLELIRLDSDFELPGSEIGTCEAGLDKLDVRLRVIDPDRGRTPCVPSCLICSTSWL